ncbi:MAG TPA: HlyC/CorC family transporter [Gammaproteobacteria bacterium]|nr:HlyC/CorC family transporter [Gammaproteobacteria bacterium]
MDEIPLTLLFVILGFLILLSGFFSGSETSLISLNRYRLRHLVKVKHPGAIRASRLLERTDRLIGLILLGNNFVNILASSIATIIALRLMGEAGIAVATGLLTLVILIFAEVTPKTLAALQPERFAFPATYVLQPLLRIFYPLVWAVNLLANGLLKLLRIPVESGSIQALSAEELRTVVNEAGAMIPRRHQTMLLSILDMEKSSVEDIMVPRNEISGIDLEQEWSEIRRHLFDSQHTRLPVYRGVIDNIVGIVHARNILRLFLEHDLTRENFMEAIREPYFIPEGTPLNTQLLNFQRERRRIGLVVDEYGDILGLATLEDILEEIVGEFTTDPAHLMREMHPQKDGSWLVDGGTSIRTLNRALGWSLPTDGPKTLSGLIVEYLETIPEPGTSLRIAGHPMEIVQTASNTVKTVRIYPEQQKGAGQDRTAHV